MDGGCRGNPGVAEYRGIDLSTGKQLFHYKITGLSTNNIAEFLAVVHGLAYARQNNIQPTVYSDSVTAIAWIRDRKCKTKFTVTDAAQKRIIVRAEEYVRVNGGAALFWSSKEWGEIPADFGRK